MWGRLFDFVIQFLPLKEGIISQGTRSTWDKLRRSLAFSVHLMPCSWTAHVAIEVSNENDWFNLPAPRRVQSSNLAYVRLLSKHDTKFCWFSSFGPGVVEYLSSSRDAMVKSWLCTALGFFKPIARGFALCIKFPSRKRSGSRTYCSSVMQKRVPHSVSCYRALEMSSCSVGALGHRTPGPVIDTS